MGPFTAIPIWIAQDLAVYAVGVFFLLFVIRREPQASARILEAIAFCFCYAAVYENFATLMGWYGYGRSILMVFNVPLSVPLVEYLVVYAALRLLDREGIPAWSKPWIVGLTGMLFDLGLDPLAMKQVFSTREGLIGRWTWYPGAEDVQILGEPVYNYTGWILLCGFFAATVLAGRYWHRKSGFKPWVGCAYPFLAALAALLILVSPLSRFLLWLWPAFSKGSQAEWVMLGVNTAVGLVLFLRYTRAGAIRAGRADTVFETPALLALVGLPLLNLLLCTGGGYWDALSIVGPSVLVLAAAALYMMGFTFRGRAGTKS